MDQLFYNLAEAPANETDILVSTPDQDGFMYVTAISERGKNIVAVVQEHGGDAYGLWQCSAPQWLLQHALKPHRRVVITQLDK